MEPRRFPFTTARLRKVPPPGHGAIYVYDTDVPGLAMRVTQAGARTFVLYKRINGRPTRITLGRVQGMSIPDARRAAQRITGQVAGGTDVLAERRAARIRGRTVADAFSSWLAIAMHKKRSWRDDKRLWELWLAKPLARRPLCEVSTSDLQRIMQDVGRSRPRTANKARALLSTVWNHAIRLGEAEANPVREVTRFPETSRERVLTDAEFERFLRAVASEAPTWRDYFLLALLTGQRRENLCRMQWNEIDFRHGVWNIPSTKSKNRRATTVPLTQLAIGLLERRREETPDPWVFPSPLGSADGCIREPRKPWLRILDRAGISDLRVHDLRRSVGTWLGASNTNSYTIARALGHQSVRSGEVYVRLGADPARLAMHQIQQARPLLSDVVQGTMTESRQDAI
jgi:integrase